MSVYKRLPALLLVMFLFAQCLSAQQLVLKSNNPADLWTSWENIARPWFMCQYAHPFEKVRIFVSNVAHGGSYEREMEFGGTPDPIQWVEDLPTGTYDWFVFFYYFYPPTNSFRWSEEYQGPTFYVDRSAPNAINLNTNGYPAYPILPPTWTNRTDLSFTWANPGDAGSGVSYYQVSVNGGAFQTVASGYSPALTTGQWSFSFRAVDYMGHVGPETKMYTKVDVSAPTCSPVCLSSNASTNPDPAWSRLNYVRFRIFAGDAGSGVRYRLFTENGSEWAAAPEDKVFGVTSGTYTWQMKARDFVDLESSIKTYYARIDLELPEISFTSPTEGFLTNADTLEAAWSASDAHSGILTHHYMLDEEEMVSTGLETSVTLKGLTEGDHRLVVRTQDSARNENRDTLNFYIDLSSPEITTSLTDQVITGNELCKAILPDYLPEISVADNYSSNISLSQNPAAGTEISGDLNEVTISAEDEAGNIATFSLNVVVSDELDPVLSFAEDKVLILEENCEVLLPDYTTDAALSVTECASFSLAQEPAAGTAISDTSTITITATDESGNTGSCSFEVAASDTTSPTIVCPEDFYITLTKSAKKGGYVIDGTMADPVSLTDNCGELTVSNDYNNDVSLAGEEFENGSYTVTWTAFDEFMNTSSCTVALTIDLVGVENIPGATDVKLYPNPAGSLLNIETRGPVPEKVIISDIHGNKLQELYPSSNRSDIDLSQLTGGVYFLTIEMEGSLLNKMVIKK